VSLVYRAIFSDDRPDLLRDVRTAFEEWVASKDLGLEVLEEGTSSGERSEVTVARSNLDSLEAVRLTLTEAGDSERWSTTATAIDDAGDRCVWVDLERISEDPYGPPPVVAVPSLVRSLISAGTAHVGPTALSATPTIVEEAEVEALVAHLVDPARRLPIIVLSKDRYATSEVALVRAGQLLTKVIGLAPVYLLEGSATNALSEALGPDLQVVGGAVRTYMPDLTVPDQSPKRHPLIAGTVFANQTASAATRIQRSLSQTAAAQSPPAIYRDHVANLPGFPRHQGDAKADEIFADLVGIEQERDDLSVQLIGLRDELEFAALQLDETEAELDAAQARVRYLEGRLRAAGDQAANEPTPAAAVPETAESCSEALGFARQYLANLEVGDTDYFASALDTYMKSPAWARKAWRAFRALDDYAELKTTDGFNGDFLAYCAATPMGLAVVPTGWVALKESESTDNNPKFRGARMFWVPAEVDDSEEIYMCAHIKVEPGKRPAPRIHFFDDTAGPTQKIYIGYFGEHLPNDQTN
jgi:hypothetical protein